MKPSYSISTTNSSSVPVQQMLHKEHVDGRSFSQWSCLGPQHCHSCQPHPLRLYHISTKEIDPQQNGYLQVFQLWLQTYFALLRPDYPDFNEYETMSFQLTHLQASNHSTKDIFQYFFDPKDLTKDKFLVCRRKSYPYFPHPPNI